MQWEPLGTTSQYKQLVLITLAKIACYLITWASFHPEKHITALCFHPSCSHRLHPSSLAGFRVAPCISLEKRSRFGQGRRKGCHLTGIPAACVCLHVHLLACPLHGVHPLASDARLLIAAMPCNLGPLFHPCPGDGVTYFMPRQGSSHLSSELPRLAEMW